MSERDCRQCRTWKGCRGKWYVTKRDSEGEVKEEEEWYSHSEIRWCPRQVFWILRHSQDFDAGRWPKPPRVLKCDAKKGNVITEATFCKPKRIIGEVRARLTKCGDKGRILERDAIRVETMTYLEDDIKSVLYYVSGWRRKDTPLRTWRAMRRYRNDNKVGVS